MITLLLVIVLSVLFFTVLKSIFAVVGFGFSLVFGLFQFILMFTLIPILGVGLLILDIVVLGAIIGYFSKT